MVSFRVDVHAAKPACIPAMAYQTKRSHHNEQTPKILLFMNMSARCASGFWPPCILGLGPCTKCLFWLQAWASTKLPSFSSCSYVTLTCIPVI